MLFLASSGSSSGSGGNKSSGSGLFSSFFAPKPDPVDLAKEWKRKLQKEARVIDREITNIKRQEEQAMKECKALAKANRLPAAKILAKEIVHTRKLIERMYTTKAQLNSVSNTLQTSVSMIKMKGCIEKSTEIMGAMNKLVNVKEISETMRDMSREMERAGLVDEIIGDAMDSMDDEGVDAEADLEIDKVISEITAGVLFSAGSAPVKALLSETPAQAVAAPSAQEGSAEATAVDEGPSADDLLRRLQAL
jgi:charged multivesicular body protein 3